MYLSELLKSKAWLSVWLTFEKLFPNQVDYYEEYKKVFNQLQTMQPKQSNITLEVSRVTDSFDNSKYVDVAGYYTLASERTNPISNSLAIEFTPWPVWLGMPIDEETLKTFTELEIIAYCLNEMTYAGFDQEDIQTELNHIKQAADEYNELTPDEKAKKTFTLDDMKDRYGLSDDELMKD